MMPDSVSVRTSASNAAATRRWASQISSGSPRNWARCSSRWAISCCQRSVSMVSSFARSSGRRSTPAARAPPRWGRSRPASAAGDLAIPQPHEPQQRTQVVAVAGPQEAAVLRVALEPVDVGEDRLVGGGADDLQPVRGVGALRVGHERAHRHGVVAQDALGALGGEGGLGAEGQAVVDALCEAGDGADKRFAVPGAAAEDDRVDRDALGRVEVGRDVGTWRGWW